jgi:hypothetical protein
MPNNKAIVGFNSGELSPKIDTRFDVNKYERGCRILKNLIATKYGGAERRGGTKFIDTAYQGATLVRMIPFIYSAAVAYKIEMSDKKFRFYFEDAVLDDGFGGESVISVPYTEDDLFALQFHQIGDVVWMTNASFQPRKLSRISPYEFSLDIIEFEDGPFELRNDLQDLTIANTATMRCTAKNVGEYGSLICSNNFFETGHKGALIQLTHQRNKTMVTLNGAGTSGSLTGQGTFTIVTRGRWSGTIYVQRREGNSEWDNFRSYRGANDRNVIESWKEEEPNTSFRINSNAGGTQAEISINTGSDNGIVRITGVGDAKNASCKVVKALQKTTATKRWSEGSWSDVRGWPSAIGFFEERAVYGGSTTGRAGDTTVTRDYPNLTNLSG